MFTWVCTSVICTSTRFPPTENGIIKRLLSISIAHRFTSLLMAVQPLEGFGLPNYELCLSILSDHGLSPSLTLLWKISVHITHLWLTILDGRFPKGPLNRPALVSLSFTALTTWPKVYLTYLSIVSYTSCEMSGNILLQLFGNKLSSYHTLQIAY